MRKILFFLLLPLALLGQNTDTTYFKVLDYEVYKFNEKTFEDGRVVTEKAKATQTESARVLIREFEQAALTHYDHAVDVLGSANLVKAIGTSNQKFLDKNGVSAVDSLKQLVLARLKGDWKLDGKECSIDGVLKQGSSVYEIETFCLPWIRLVFQGNATDYYLIEPDKYVSMGGSVLIKIKKE